MISDLGSKLQECGLVTQRQLEAAIGTRPPHDGELIRALTRRGVPATGIVGFYVVQGYGPAVSQDELQKAQHKALKLIPADLAFQALVLPLRVNKGIIDVAMVAPNDASLLLRLEKASGHEVNARIAGLQDLESALQHFYAVTSEERRLPSAMITPSGEESTNADTPPQPQKKQRARRVRHHRTNPELFAANRQEKISTVAEPTAPSDTALSEEEAEAVPLIRPKSQSTKIPANLRVKPRHTQPFGTKISDEQKQSQNTPTPSKVEIPHPRVPQLSTNDESPRDSEAQENTNEPNTPKTIFEAMAQAPDVDTLVRCLCEGALPLGRSNVFLARRGNVLRGFDGRGPSLTTETVKEICLPSNSRSPFRTVLNTLTPYRGPHGTSSGDRLFRSAIGSTGSHLYIHPVKAGPKLVGLLAIDRLVDQSAAEQQVGALTEAAGQAFARIIRGKKK